MTDLITQADDLTKKIWKNQENPEFLSLAIIQLAVISAGIGNLLAEAQNEARQSETGYKYEVERVKLDFVDNGMAAGVAESRAKLLLVDAAKYVDDTAHKANTLKLKRQDVDKLIDTIRTRVSLIKKDITNS